MEVLGIDIGGSGIKGAPVDIDNGILLEARCRIPTPDPAKPRPVATTVAEIVRHFNWQGPVGCGFPAVIRKGVVASAANIHDKWIGTYVQELFAETTGCPITVINDADAAGLAEMAFGAGKGRSGTVLLITIGTGLGSAIFTNGHLLPNTELGHIEIDGYEAEWRASDAARKREKLSWKKWVKRLDNYLLTMEHLFSPDLIVLGGGVSKKYQSFVPQLTLNTEVVPAHLLNEAGIIGAALAAQELLTQSE